MTAYHGIPIAKTLVGAGAIWLAAGFALGLFEPVKPRVDSSPTKAATVFIDPEHSIRIRNVVTGCTDMAELERLWSLTADKAAQEKLYMADVMAGRCRTFRPGADVFVTDASFWQNGARIRQAGSVDLFWVSRTQLEEAR